ncbi:carbohydrate esterase family 1 protein [Cercophora newfieldiana]|uniref:Feruloyl esterase C n=1 Tax=Cercophora newfieldiana TaxID=92897 RepID=A0AA40CUW2_9PEZI|nr:carbohydrate esterase family 1 protein [Cercophora newfieldiana]
MQEADSPKVATSKTSPGCGKTPAAFRNTSSSNHTATVNQKQRLYTVQLPQGYNNTRPHRLVFTFHGYGDSGTTVATGTKTYLPYFGLPPLAPHDTIFVAPTGLNTVWADTGGEDVAFVDAMVQAIEADLCVDPTLRFATGFSFGGAMAYALACARPSAFRAVAVLSGGALSGCAGPGTEPVAYYGQHGVADGQVAIAAGRQLRDRFVGNNNCTTGGGGNGSVVVEPSVGDGRMVKMEYEGCAEGYPVVWVAFDGGHTPTPVVRGEDVTFSAREIWEFFGRFGSR